MGSLDPQNKILFYFLKKTTIMAKKKAGRGVGKKKNFGTLKLSQHICSED